MTVTNLANRLAKMQSLLKQAMDCNDELCHMTSRDNNLAGKGFKIAITLVAQHTWMKKLEAHINDMHEKMEGLAEHFAAADAVIEAALETDLDDELT